MRSSRDADTHLAYRKRISPHFQQLCLFGGSERTIGGHDLAIAFATLREDVRILHSPWIDGPMPTYFAETVRETNKICHIWSRCFAFLKFVWTVRPRADGIDNDKHTDDYCCKSTIQQRKISRNKNNYSRRTVQDRRWPSRCGRVKICRGAHVHWAGC